MASRYIRKNETINEDYIKVKVAEPPGWDPLDEDSLLGRTAIRDIMKDEPVTANCVL